MTETVLALDTCTPVLSVAVAGPDARASMEIDAGHGMGEVLAPTVQRVLADAGVDRDRLSAVAVGCGPAPYTSLRVGIMFAKAVGWALGIPVVGACSLDVIARAVPVGEPFGVATDARRREVYWASYDARGCRLRGPLVGAPATVVEACGRWYGPGFVRHPVGLDPLSERGPDALRLADWLLAEGWQAIDPEAPVRVGDRVDRILPAALAPADGDGSEVAGVPQDFFEPAPLYLRRPDAQEPSWRP